VPFLASVQCLAARNVDAQELCAYDCFVTLHESSAMQATETAKSARKPANLSIDSVLLKEVKALGINVSRRALPKP